MLFIHSQAAATPLPSAAYVLLNPADITQPKLGLSSTPTRTDIAVPIGEKYVPTSPHKDDEPSSSHGLPRIVHREFDNYLKCGRLEHGFVKLACLDCHRTTLVAFSCKGRGFCPSCGARRMSQTAAHWVDNVLPTQPYRQWVLSLPYPLRILLARDPEVLSLTLNITKQVISRYLTLQVSHQVAHTGGVAVVQRFGSALNLNPHFHILMLDGVYIYAKNGQLKFLQSKPLTKEDILKITIRIAQRVAKALERTGHLVRDDEQGHYLPEQDVNLLGDMQSHSITYRIATGLKKGEKVLKLQLLPPADNGKSSSSSDPIANYACNGELILMR